MKKYSLSILTALCLVFSAIAYNLATDHVAYVVTDAHLDTQWLYDITSTINQFIPNTLHQNFALFPKYPNYVFNFEGAYRYWIAKTKYPADYATLKTYIAAGNWAVCGGMVEMSDVNIQSAENLMREFLYGNGFFMDEFNKKSIQIQLPDNFGFTWALPTIAVHCGMKGFSGMRVANCVPSISAPICRWKGPDGSYLIAIHNTGNYNTGNSTTPWTSTTNGDATSSNTKGALWAQWSYFGTGDRGGAPADAMVSQLMARIADNANQTVKVTNASGDQFFLDLSQTQIDALPEHNNEFHLAWAGSWTSNGLMKLKNRQTEQRALAAERASVLANAYAGTPYQSQKIWLAWLRLCSRGFHDDICGTSNAAADAYSYKAFDSCYNEFTQVMNDATNGFSSVLNTQVSESDRIPIVVFNPLANDRHDIVEATVNFAAGVPAGVKVFNQAGFEVPAQILSTTGQTAVIAFVAHVPSISYALYEAKPVTTANPPSANLTIDATTGILENSNYRVTVNTNGDISAILDKKTNQQLLSAPSRLEGRTQTGDAYNIYRNVMVSTPIWYVDETVVRTVAENGPARVSLKIARTKDGSTYTQYVRLAADSAGTRVEVANTVDWKSIQTLLSVSFPMTCSNPYATYDLGIGTIQRQNINTDQARYDHVAQQWADITTSNNSYGLSILNDCKYGWHMPSNSSLCLELINGGSGGWGNYEGDHYVHNFKYAFYGHSGDWTNGTVAEAAGLNQPLLAFQTASHNGTAGRVVSFLQTSTPQCDVMALKKAEKSPAYVVRVREASGKAIQGAAITFASDILSASELLGSEEPKPNGSAPFSGKTLTFNLTPYQPKTFSVTLNLSTAINPQSFKNIKSKSGNRVITVSVAAEHGLKTALKLPVNGTIRGISVFDALGNLVQKFAPKDVEMETGNIVWNGRDENAGHVRPGIYFVTISTDLYKSTGKLSLP
jgi:alpha-mannosidase